MKLNLLLCGKTDFPWTATGMDIYSKRIKNYVPFDIKVLPDLKNTANLSGDEIKTAEGQKILNAITPSDFVILLDENGRNMSSVDFASDIQKLMNRHKIHNVLVADADKHLLGIVDRYACVL